MPINEAWRTPALKLLANGRPIAGAIDAEVTSNNRFAADRFSARIAFDADPLAGASFWADSQGTLIDLALSLDGISYQSLIRGLVDSVLIDPMAALVRIEGRDLSAPLIEARTQQTFTNRTSSEIASLLAQRHGLTPAVTPTTTPVGRYYQSEHDRITLDRFSRAITEWDLLVFLARQESFDVFVQGTVLFFQPMLPPTPPFMLQPTSVSELRLSRSLTLARDIEVTVKSWNSRQKNAFAQTARATGRPSINHLNGISSQPPQRYIFVRPNLTQDQALQLAQRKLSELTQHERVIEATMPGELVLTPRSQIALTGTGTGFDQTYFVDMIERSLSPRAGFIQRIRAKNTSPRTETTVPADVVGTDPEA